jgi:hypothetical protein
VVIRKIVVGVVVAILGVVVDVVEVVVGSGVVVVVVVVVIGVVAAVVIICLGRLVVVVFLTGVNLFSVSPEKNFEVETEGVNVGKESSTVEIGSLNNSLEISLAKGEPAVIKLNLIKSLNVKKY